MALQKTEARPSQQFVDIKEIRNGVVMLRSGALRQIVMVSGVNFALKSEDEQNLILYSYQSFLNSLDFSVQLLVHSRKLDIEKYLLKIKEIEAAETNELLKNQLAEYHEFIKSFVGINDIMNKNFFAVVPYDPISIPSPPTTQKKPLLSFLKPKSASQTAAPSPDDDKAFQRNLEQLTQPTNPDVTAPY